MVSLARATKARILNISVLLVGQVMGDSSPDADKLMRSQGVRALPSFHFWKNKKQVDSVSGAKTQALQDAIEQHM